MSAAVTSEGLRDTPHPKWVSPIGTILSGCPQSAPAVHLGAVPAVGVVRRSFNTRPAKVLLHARPPELPAHQVLDVPLRPLVGVRGRRRTDRGRRGRTGRPGWRRRGIGRRTWRRPGRRRRRGGIENACSILHGSQNLARLFSSTVLKNAIASRRLATTPYRPGQALTGLLPPCRLSGADGSGGRGVGRWAAQCARAPVRRPSRAAGCRCHHSPRRQP